MNDIEVSSIDLVEGGNVFKQGHYLTLGYVPRDEKGETVDLSGKTLNVSLWGRKGVVFEAAATYSGGVIRFTFDKMVPAGDYTVEFTATSSTDAKYRKKFPTNQHSGRIAIKQSADDLGVVGIQVYTVAQLKAEQKALLDAAVSGFTVDSETQMARVSDDKTYTSLRARLEGDKQETAAQLADKVGDGKKAEPEDFSDRAMALLTGNGTVNVLSIPQDKSVSLKKTTFSKIVSKNLFNKNAVTPDVVLVSSTGATTNSFATAYATETDYKAITPGIGYAFTKIFLISWYDTNKIFISSNASPWLVTAPTNARYLRISVEKTNLELAQMEIGAARTSYVPFKEVIDKAFMEEQTISSTQLGEAFVQTGLTTDISNAAAVVAEDHAKRNIPNVANPLNIPSYDGSNEITHASTLYFKDGWNGYRFWMAMTPYPNSNNQLENPSIVASNDNVSWVAPAANPIAPLPADRAFQSDPCIFMRGNLMEMWYREHIAISGGYNTEIWRMTTTDGVNWTPKEKMFDNTGFEVVRSQAVRYDSGKYRMWYHQGENEASYILKYAESTDGKSWVDVRTLSVIFPANHVPWHLDAIINNGKIELLISSKTTDGSKWSLFHTYSIDNYNFHRAIKVVEPSRVAGKWDSLDLYRSSFMLVDGRYYVYYATPKKIGLTVGDSMYSLNERPDTFRRPEMIITGSNVYTASTPISDFPMDKVVFTKTFGGQYGIVHGFPEDGLLETRRLVGESGYDFQLLHGKSTNNVYRRFTTSGGWGAFVKFSGVTV